MVFRVEFDQMLGLSDYLFKPLTLGTEIRLAALTASAFKLSSPQAPFFAAIDVDLWLQILMKRTRTRSYQTEHKFLLRNACSAYMDCDTSTPCANAFGCIEMTTTCCAEGQQRDGNLSGAMQFDACQSPGHVGSAVS